jgi:RNA polymerase sigma factor (sigma-70 family)
MSEIIRSENHNLPVNFSDLTSEEKQREREKLYNFSKEPNFDEYSRLENYHILHYVEKVPDTGKKGDEYRNHFKWDIQALKEVCESENMDFEKVNALLIPEQVLSYSRVEKIFDGEDDLIMKTMTLLTHNYSNVILDTKERLYYEQIDSDDYVRFSPSLLFNSSEEKLFLTGKRLLDEYNNDSDYPYIEDLSKKTSNIIMSFNQGLIIDGAKKYLYRIPFDDLFQEGRLGMLRAIKKFEIDKNKKFSTYAKWWVDRFIKLCVVNNYSQIYHPNDLMQYVFNFKKERDEMEFELQREPTFDEVVEQCNEKNIKLPGQLDAIKLVLQQTDIKSLDKPIDVDRENTLFDVIAKNEADVKESNLARDYFRFVDFLLRETDLSDLELLILGLHTEIKLNGYKFESRTYNYKQISTLLKIPVKDLGKTKRQAIKKLRKTASLYEFDAL